MEKQKGLALVLVLWVLSLLTIMAGSFALNMRRESAIIAGVKTNAQAMAVAESGIAMAEMMLLGPDPNMVWRTDGGIYEIDSEDAKIRVRMLSESGKIDINKADEALLQSLMASAPVDTDLQTKLVSAILDWRDADDLVHVEGAEKDEYQEAGLSYQPRNKAFQSIEELQLVLGMNESVFKWIEPLVTIYSGQQQVNIQQADKEVLQVIPGLDGGLIDSFIADRLESARNNLPAPPFPSSSGQNISPAQNTALTIVSDALLNDGSRALISAVIKKSDNAQTAPFETYRWQLLTANGASLFTDAMSELLVKQYAGPELNN
ncbi:MAG: type II secretion system protein GspK [Methylococcales bacterium]|nr:type II secretion system protein GspK [Methylococcales bacterium]